MKWPGCMSTMSVGFAVIVVFLLPWATADAAAQRGAARPKVERPDGPVWEVIRYNCISCHGIDDYAFFALDRDGWGSLIDTKHEGLGKVSLSDDERKLLLDYLVEEFGPDSTPFPRSYVPPEITEFLTDPEAYRIIEGACTSCHDRERINAERNSLDGWRVVLVDMRERGAVLTDEDLEKLAEWLSRVMGINPNQ